MLHVFFGNNTIGVRKKAFAYIVAQEALGFKVERIEGDFYVQGMCTDIAGSLSLFGEKTLYVLDTPSTEAHFDEEVQASLELFKDSQNIFVVIEEKLLAPAKKVYGKYAESIEEITEETEVRFNVFALADSLSSKDKKTLWLQLQDAMGEGLSAEEIIGTLWWQLKSMRLSQVTASAEQAGMKDFPYNKAKRSVKNFKEGEIETLSRSLLEVYHDGHLGKKDINLSLEKWVLTI